MESTAEPRGRRGTLVRAWVAGLLAAVGVVMGVSVEDLTYRATKSTASEVTSTAAPRPDPTSRTGA